MSGRRDRGSASVLTLVMASVLLATAVGAGIIGGAFVAHRQAAAAADLAALTGAVALQRGEDPCAAAVRVAARNQAQVTRCAVTGAEVQLSVAVRPRSPILTAVLGGDPLAARARAGPASDHPAPTSW